MKLMSGFRWEIHSFKPIYLETDKTDFVEGYVSDDMLEKSAERHLNKKLKSGKTCNLANFARGFRRK